MPKRKKLADTSQQVLISGSRLKYQQAKDWLLQQIAAGELKPGDALPSERALAKLLGCGVHTVRQALSELTTAHVVSRTRGKGTFVEVPPQNLRKRLNVYGLIVPEVCGSLYPSLIKGFVEASVRTHHQVLICHTGLDLRSQSDVILQLTDKNVAGVAIVPTIEPMPAYQLKALQSQQIPVVFCHRRPPDVAAPWIGWDWEKVGRMAAEILIQRGHRRLALVGTSRYEVTEGYERGFIGALNEAGLDLPDHRILYHAELARSAAEDEAHRAVAKMLRRPDRPTGIFASDVIEGERVFFEAMKLGLRIPRDLSLVGFGGGLCLGALSERLATVTVDEVELGRRAVALIEEIRTGREPLTSQQRIVMPLKLSEGETLGAP
ncbi:MAG: GntR family transcriptional regulator [Rhodopirellula sp.]|nr:GntR family transcriptional regulator [Rhodopirellula sp.]